MKRLTWILLIGTMFLFTYCTPKFLTPTQADADRASQNFSGTTLADLNNGYQLYIDRCNNCHWLKHPKKKSLEAWSHILPKMAHKAKIDINSQDYKDLKAYIYTLHDRP